MCNVSLYRIDFYLPVVRPQAPPPQPSLSSSLSPPQSVADARAVELAHSHNAGAGAGSGAGASGGGSASHGPPVEHVLLNAPPPLPGHGPPVHHPMQPPIQHPFPAPRSGHPPHPGAMHLPTLPFHPSMLPEPVGPGGFYGPPFPFSRMMPPPFGQVFHGPDMYGPGYGPFPFAGPLSFGPDGYPMGWAEGYNTFEYNVCESLPEEAMYGPYPGYVESQSPEARHSLTATSVSSGPSSLTGNGAEKHGVPSSLSGSVLTPSPPTLFSHFLDLLIGLLKQRSLSADTRY